MSIRKEKLAKRDGILLGFAYGIAFSALWVGFPILLAWQYL
jgi:hypothetical protein